MAYVKQGLQIPVPGLRHNVGLGDVIKRMTQAIGVKPCPPCEKRAAMLNRLVQLRGRRR